MKLLSVSSAASLAFFVSTTVNVATGFSTTRSSSLQRSQQQQQQQQLLRSIDRRAVLSSSSSSSSTKLHVNLPRLDLPDAVTDKLEEFDLKNPNKMDESEYKGYAGAAILGTLLFFLLPGAVITGVPEKLGAILGASIPDFAFSALTGGGLAIYLSLRDDELGGQVRFYGSKLLDTVGLPTFRYDLPSQVTDVMTDKLGLMNPNEMDEFDYNGYSGAAVAGTLLFFLLPGAALTGQFANVGEFGGAAIKDFVFAALIGGGLAIYLSLRKDIGTTVNDAGVKLLDTVDDLLGSTSNLLAESSSSASSSSSTSEPAEAPAATATTATTETEKTDEPTKLGAI